MILQAINLGLLTILFFIIGMINPRWVLFFMQKPTRWPVVAGTTLMFMIVMTMYGEGLRQQKILEKHKHQEEAKAAAAASLSASESVPVPVPVETPKKEVAKKK